MKKTVFFVVLQVMLAFALCFSASASEPAVRNVEFTKSDSALTVAASIDADSEAKVLLAAALYSADGTMNFVEAKWFDISADSAEVSLSGVKTPGDGEYLRAYLWNESLKPLCKPYDYEKEASVFAVTANVYGNEYQGSINEARGTVTFDVPKSLSSYNNIGINTALKRGSLTVGNHHFDGDYTLSLSGASASFGGSRVTEETSFDMASDSVIEVTMPDGISKSYTVEVNASERVIYHNFNSAVIITEETDATRWADDTRKYLPNSVGITGSTIVRGTGHFAKNGEEYDFTAGAGSFGLVDVTDDNAAFEINKTSAGPLRAYATSGNDEPQNPEKLINTYKINLTSADENKNLAQLYTSDLTRLVLTTAGTDSGTYTLARKSADGTEAIADAPVMKLGDWYEIKTVYRKDVSASDSGYIVELYVDNSFICEFTGESGVTGALDAAGSYPQMSVDCYEDALFRLLMDEYSVNLVRPRADIYAEKLPDGKNAAYTFTGDDGFKASAAWYNKVLKENGLKGSLALIVNRLGTTNFGDYAFFNEIFADGVLSAANHSLSHPRLTEDGIDLEAQINDAQKALRANLPGQKVLGYVLPFNSTNTTVTEKVAENHYGIRRTDGIATLHPTMAEMNTISFKSLSSSTTAETMNSWVDSAAQNGNWLVEMWHEVIGDDVGEEGRTTDGGVDSALARQHFEYIASHSDEIYSGTFDDMLCYILERQWMRFTKDETSSTENEHRYKAWYLPDSMLKIESDAQYFDVPVTVNVTIPDSWTKVVVSDNGDEYFAEIHTEQTAVYGAEPKKYVLVKAVPVNGEPQAANVVIKNVPDDYALANKEKEITSIVMTADGKTYEGLINSETNEITFSVPYSTIRIEASDAASGTKSPGITPDMSEVTFDAEVTGTLTANGAAVDSATVLNADELETLDVISASGGVRSYKLNFDYMAVSRRYNANGAVLLSTSHNEANRRGAPAYLGGGTVYSGNIGDGVWRHSGIAYNADGTLDEESTYASISIEKRADNESDSYIRLNKYKVGSNVQLYSQNDFGNDSDVVRTQFRFNLASFENNNDGMIYMNTSDLDQIVLSCKNTSDGRFILGHRATSSDQIINVPNCPELETGKWYTLTTVFRKGEQYANGYVIEIYLDGEYLASVANQNKVPSGTVHRVLGSYTNGKNEFTLNSWRNSVYDLYIDDYEVMTVDNDGSADKTTVYLLGDSICRYYADSYAPQQGWGKYFDEVFDESVRVRNYSVGGYNTNIYLHGANRTNFKSAPIWATIKRQIREGDYVFIALGHNEANSTDGTKTTANFTANLKTLADEIAAMGAAPVFVTATPQLASSTTDGVTVYGEVINTMSFTGIGNKVYPARDMRSFAAENGYLCLDLNSEAYHALRKMEQSEYHDMFTGSTSKATDNSYNKDSLHITEDGAQLMSNLLVKLLSESDCELKNKLKTPYDTNHAYVKSASAVIDGVTYTADVNTQRNTVSFELAAVQPKTGTAVHPSAEAAEVSFEANGVVTADSVMDLTAPQTITVTSPDGTDVQTYTVQADLSTYARTYNAQAGKNESTAHATAARRGAPAYDSNSKGGGAWFVENYAFDADGTAIEDETYGSVNVQTDSANSANKVIKFLKTKTGKPLSFSSNSTDYASLNSNSKISVEFKVRINDMNDGGTLYINSSRLDHILLTRIGAPEGKYFIGYRPYADDDSYLVCTDEPLSFGEWHTVKYVFRKNTALESGYTMEIYLDGNFITETDCKNRLSTAGEYIQPAGSLYNWPSAFSVLNAQIAVRSFSATLADIDFDDFVITNVSDYE